MVMRIQVIRFLGFFLRRFRDSLHLLSISLLEKLSDIWAMESIQLLNAPVQFAVSQVFDTLGVV